MSPRTLGIAGLLAFLCTTLFLWRRAHTAEAPPSPGADYRSPLQCEFQRNADGRILTVKNTGHEPVRLLKWNTPFSANPDEVPGFRVDSPDGNPKSLRPGVRLAHHLPALARDDDYMILKPGEERVSSPFKLSRWWDLVEPEERVRIQYALPDGFGGFALCRDL